MENKKKLNIEVAYATPDKQLIIPLEVEEGCTIETAIDRSGVLEHFPEIDLRRQKVGVFSKSRHLYDVINEGERIEIYRELTIDPKEARRKRAVDAGQVMPVKHARRQGKNKKNQ